MQFNLVIPGDIKTISGGYLYDRRLVEDAPRFGVELLPVKPLGDDKPSLIDGLALGHMTKNQIDQLKSPFVALIHHPLYLEAGLSAEIAKKLFEQEKYALLKARHVITTSHTTAKIIEDNFDVLPHKITIALPGTAEIPRNQGQGGNRYLAIGSIIPRKNYPFLLETLQDLKSDWHLDLIGGFVDLDETAKVKVLCDHRVTLHGSIENLDRFYETCDLFLMPSLYEGYGMVMSESLKAGCAIISSRGGALNDTLPDDCGIKCEASDKLQWLEAINQMNDLKSRQSYREKAFSYGQTLPTRLDTARIITDCLKEHLT